MRHAITKLSHLHFVAADEFRDRVIQMGEAPERTLPDRAAVAERVGLSLDRALLLVTYHPATLVAGDPVADLDELLAALDRFKDAAIVFTKANADAGGRAINARLESWVAANRERAVLVASLGSDFYFAALKEAAAVIGNSSSGLIEAPAAGAPTVNIGPRQDGRPRSASVIDCADRRDAIEAAIRRALDDQMREVIANQTPAYGRAGNASRLIFEKLRNVPIEGILSKRFHKIGATGSAGAEAAGVRR
jgi:UDP-N-acetylglucosamine 2-epimerase (non-hydrolysing)/GDP/UDP-N,N'-diacetylbacillosamine 2-epimerase (hydrolysing)